MQKNIEPAVKASANFWGRRTKIGRPSVNASPNMTREVASSSANARNRRAAAPVASAAPSYFSWAQGVQAASLSSALSSTASARSTT